MILYRYEHIFTEENYVLVIGVDTGGTFTDFVCFDGREKKVFKVLSTPKNPAEAVLEGLKELGGGLTKEVVHGSTVATNAILERKGAKTALLTNRGFEDVIEIGRQNREEIYNLRYKKPEPIVPRELRFGIPGRLLFDGSTLEELSIETLERVAALLKKERVESVAICFLFSYVNPQHEIQAKHIITDNRISVSLSHEILPEFREFERTSTTVLNAYVSPVMHRYISQLRSSLGKEDKLRIMQSNGGSISGETAIRESVRTILSGPAGGVVGAFEVARLAGFEKVITFDMGGTSTDVSLVDRAPILTTESKIANYPVKVPMIDIHTVGAGGGSIAYVDAGGSLRVGPRSAGASPGPICYGRGSEITVTDANLLLGRLIPESFLGGKMKLHAERLHAYFKQMAVTLKMDPITLALGIISVASATMERAIRVISVERGENPEEFVLVAFGGAGGLHAAFLANALSIPRVLIPENPGALSAFGMLMADVIKDYSQTVMLKGDKVKHKELTELFQGLRKRGQKELEAEGISQNNINFEPYLDMRYAGQSHEITIPFSPNYTEAFHKYHERFFGYKSPAKEAEIVSVRLRCRGMKEKPKRVGGRRRQKKLRKEACLGYRNVFFENFSPRKTIILKRDKLSFGNLIKGPAIIVEYTSTIVVPPGWFCEVDKYRNLLFYQR